jgi:hypothetical protein
MTGGTNSLVAFYSVVLFAGLAIFSASGCEKLGLGHPSVTPQQIEASIIGKVVGQGFGKWQFEAKEPREITIVEEKQESDKAKVLIGIKTNSVGWSTSACAGRLMLTFEWMADEWNLITVENVSFNCD